MPAPDLATLYRPEEFIERAVVDVLTRNGIAAFRSRDRAKAKTPAVHVKFWPGKPTGHRGQYRPGFFCYDAWNGTLVCTVFTNRADPSQAAYGAPAMGAEVNTDSGTDAHGLLLGQVRVFFQYQSEQFTAANPFLPYHALVQIQDNGAIPDVNTDTDLDATPLSYQILFCVRGDAWPLLPSP